MSYFYEEERVKSFLFWPYGEKSSCSKTKMADAGFYWSGTKDEIDSATCFVCGKVLDGWESTDEPWMEHKKHAPQCAFVKFGESQCELTVNQMLTLSEIVIKNQLTKRYNKTISKVRKESEKIKNIN